MADEIRNSDSRARVVRLLRHRDDAGAWGFATSRSYFIKAFKKKPSRNPHSWLLEHLVARAKEMLLHSFPIADITPECCFADQSHFTRVFTYLMRRPPGVWRR
jgi:AraC-like DNA-binding protein